ncbi:MAG: RluA family pseudouridine synthase [Candidatus Paceibacterota bacterium]
MKIKVLYEDSNILAIDKPSGISVHGDGRSKDKTIADWIFKNYPKMKNVGEMQVFENKKIKVEIPKPGIVHRLDNETSGVMLLAKNEKAYQFLKKQFQDRVVKKIYVAIVDGWIKDDRGLIKKPIGRSPSDFRKYSSSRGARGEMRDALTQYKVLKRFEKKAKPCEIFSRFTLKGSDTAKKSHKVLLHKFTYVELSPKTGRTHQIRVHMKFIDHPVVCDSLYNPKGSCPKIISRMGLHAKSIEFKDLKGKTIKVESNIPLEFKKMVK